MGDDVAMAVVVMVVVMAVVIAIVAVFVVANLHDVLRGVLVCRLPKVSHALGVGEGADT